MEYIDAVLAIVESMFSTGESTVVSIVVFAIVALGGLYIKFKRVDMEKRKMYSDIDETRLTQMADQLRQADNGRRTAEQEADLYEMERDHYRSRVRDLVFMIKQLHWTFQQCDGKCNSSHKVMKWPLDHDIDYIEQWSMVSPLEAGYQSEMIEERRLSDTRREDERTGGRRASDG